MSRLLPMPLGLAGGAVGGIVWWFLLLLNPGIHNELDEVEAYVILGTVFLGWGLILGCLFALVPPFRLRDPTRAAVAYRLRRTIWLYALPVLLLWAAGIGLAVEISQRGTGIHEEMLLILVFPLTLLGAAWLTGEVCDWIQPALPPLPGALVAAAVVLVTSLSLGTILLLASPFIFEMALPQGNATAMDAAMAYLDDDLEVFSALMMGPAVHGATLAFMVPACEAVWGVPRPRRRDLGTPPYLVLALLPVIAVFDLLAVLAWAL